MSLGGAAIVVIVINTSVSALPPPKYGTGLYITEHIVKYGDSKYERVASTTDFYIPFYSKAEIEQDPTLNDRLNWDKYYKYYHEMTSVKETGIKI